jgi:hypothetical protein
MLIFRGKSGKVSDAFICFTGKDIYRYSKRIKRASQQLNTSEPGLAGDVIYNRDVLKWRKFANS